MDKIIDGLENIIERTIETYDRNIRNISSDILRDFLKNTGIFMAGYSKEEVIESFKILESKYISSV